MSSSRLAPFVTYALRLPVADRAAFVRLFWLTTGIVLTPNMTARR